LAGNANDRDMAPPLTAISVLESRWYG